MRPTLTHIHFLVAAGLLAACAGTTPAEEPAVPEEPGQAPAAAAPGEAAAPAPAPAVRRNVPPPPPDPLAHRDDVPPDRRVMLVIDGEERIVHEDAARAAGYGIVSLRDDWTPYIFQPMQDAEGQALENRYRRIFIGLANDELDEDGRALPDDEKNYLEVFGIPPAMSVLRERSVGDADKACHAEIDYALIAKLDKLTYRSDAKERKHQREVARDEKRLEEAMKKVGVDSYAALVAADDGWQDAVDKVERYALEKAVLDQIEKRLDCDEHNHKRYRHKKGQLDDGLRLALRRFQRKHKLYEHTNLKGQTMKVMARPPLQTNYAAFVRALTERVVAATGVLEDGTATVGGKTPTYVGRDGKTHEVRNLVEEFVQATLKQAGVDTPEKLLEFFRRHPAEHFQWLRVGVKFPELPEYYSGHMELDMEIDRGDVWYDPPWDDTGKRVYQRRAQMPKLSIYVTYNDQRFRLIRWPTTIGGWRAEQAPNGYEYYRYKGSDIGDRVIRKVIAGPVWVPPASTPLRSLAKRTYINGKAQGVVNYDELGPSYLSAYGLVAGYFVVPGKDGRPDWDNGIRAHGSSDYMSIRSEQRYSHGCHRLMNHSAVRLYGFLLNRRNSVVEGDQPIRHHRQFLYKDGVYELRLLTRGFQFKLDPPLPVKVLEGRIKGRRSKPINDYVKIPGHKYPDSTPKPGAADPESKAADGEKKIKGEDDA